FTYTPNAGFTGDDSFTFTAIDTSINTVSATATVSLSVSPPPTAAVNPLANDATLSLYENQPLNGSLSAVDANGNPLSYAIATQPAHGKISVTAASGAFVYTPDAGYAGKDSFTFIATDTVSKLASSAATVTLNVTSPPLADVAPLTSDTAFTLFAGTSLNGALSAVDANGNAVSYAIGTKPKNGTVTVTAATGAFSYTPNAGYTGTDSFTFTATDTKTKLASAAATVSLTIAPAPPAPVHHGGPRGGGAFGWLTLVLLAFVTLWRSFTVKSFRYAATFRYMWIAGPLLFVVLSRSVAAQDAAAPSPNPADAWYLGGQAGIIKPDSKRNASTHGFHSWDLLFGREFGDYSLEFAFAYHADNPRTTNDIASWTNYGANGLWYFRHRDASRFSPFAYGGVGLLNQYRGDNSKVRNPYLALGAGFDSTFGQPTPIRLRADVQLQHVFSGYNDLILSVGLVIPFGGSTPAWQPAALPTQPPLEEYPMAWCTERGGHPYLSDQGWVCLPAAGSSDNGGCESKATDKAHNADNQKQPCPPR
ncbi:MAG TPA: Ig-like domain-containing protein, partial [Gammaproteobacteria bacterium]|nr:Ig-like domain-containing protein [Gammaproteobacteria bacterium]